MNALAESPRGPGEQLLRFAGFAILLIIFGGVLLMFAGGGPPKLDDNLCPKFPARETVLLLDTTDPLTPKHRSELESLVEKIKGVRSSEGFYVAPGEALIVYELGTDLGNMEPKMKVCNPGDNPDDMDWKDELTLGKKVAMHNWKKFGDKVQELFPEESQGEKPTSPILESLGVIMPGHAPDKRGISAGDETGVHLIIFSDLLQHSDSLSHYGRYPEAENLMSVPRLRPLATDLHRVRVSLFRLQRGSKRQTTEHYYWWTTLIEVLGGKLHWQEEI